MTPETKLKVIEILSRMEKGARWFVSHDRHPKYAEYMRAYEGLVSDLIKMGASTELIGLIEAQYFLGGRYEGGYDPERELLDL